MPKNYSSAINRFTSTDPLEGEEYLNDNPPPERRIVQRLTRDSISLRERKLDQQARIAAKRVKKTKKTAHKLAPPPKATTEAKLNFKQYLQERKSNQG